MLSIVIPTYNRNTEVVETVKRVLPQLSENCTLTILDNHSDKPISQSLEDAGINIVGNKFVTLIRNNVNVGGQANLLRCIEICSTKWLWILGDDDLPDPNAVEIIFEDLNKHSDYTFFNYCSPSHVREQEVKSNGITEFLNSFNNWGQINFTSICILNATNVKPYLRFGFSYAYSWSCINACLISCIVKEGGKALFSKKIILSEINTCSDDNTWVPLGPHMGKSILLELLPEKKDKKRLAELMNDKPSLEYIVCLLNELIITTGQKDHYLFLYRNLIDRIYYFNRNPIVSIKIRLYSQLLVFPQLGATLINYFLQRSNRVVTISLNQLNRL